MSTPESFLLEAPPSRDAAVSSGPSPTAATDPSTLHLIGAGKVGRAFLRRIADAALPVRLVAVSDRSATVFAPAGLDGRAIAGWKESGRSFAAHPRAAGLALDLAVAVADAQLVVDATDSRLDPEARLDSIGRTLALLQRGVRVVLAAKTPLLADPAQLLPHRDRLGANAALGGTGRALLSELDELRERTTAVACVPNATTTAIVSALERGGSIDEGLAQARAEGLLESDPAQDLDGRDAALKLALVARLLFGADGARAAAPGSIGCHGVAALDAGLLARRRARGTTTRLVGRAARSGELSLAWEEVARGSPLAAAPGCVVYAYERPDGSARVHLGSGVGAGATADALIEDVRALVSVAAARSPR